MELNSLILVKNEDYLLYAHKKAEAQELYKLIRNNKQMLSMSIEDIQKAEEELDIEDMQNSQKIVELMNLGLEQKGDILKNAVGKPHNSKKERKNSVDIHRQSKDYVQTAETPKVKKIQNTRSLSNSQLNLPSRSNEILGLIDNIPKQPDITFRSSASQLNLPKTKPSKLSTDYKASKESHSSDLSKESSYKRAKDIYQEATKNKKLSLSIMTQYTYPSMVCSDRTPHTVHISPQVLSEASHKKLDKKVLQKYLLRVQANLQDTLSTDPSELTSLPSAQTTRRKKSISKYKSKSSRLKLRSKASTPNSVENMNTVSYRRSSDKISTQIEETDTVDKRSQDDDLVKYLLKNDSSIQNHTIQNLKKHKNLNNRLYSMMKQSPAELYRIISSQDHMNKKLKDELGKDVEWTEEKEQAFKTLSFNSHNYNSIAKTRLFQEAEKKLPFSKTVQDKEWRYDIHSPWVNDLDFKPQSTKTDSSKPYKSISNLIRKNAPVELTSEQQLIKHKQKLQETTGEKNQDNLYILEKIQDHIDKIHDLKDKIHGKNVIETWKKGKNNLEAARVKLSDYIIDECEVAKKKLNKGRYAYLSSKVAHQRACIEIYDKTMLKAERKRQKLRKKQEKFQRELIIARNIANRLYGSSYSGRKRALETTAHPIGSPLFRKCMLKLGYLPEDLSPQPKRLLTPQPSSEKPDLTSIHTQSKSNLSKWNYSDTLNQKKLEKLRNFAASKVTAIMKGYIVRLRCRRMKEATIKIQRAFRVYRSRKIFFKYLIYDQIIQGNYPYPYLMRKFRYSDLFQRIIKELRNNTNSLNSSFVRMVEKAARNASPGHEDKSLSAKIVGIHTRLQKLGYLSPKLTRKFSYENISHTDRSEQGKAQEINELKQNILQNRAEMWKLYIAGMFSYCPSDEELAYIMRPEHELINILKSGSEFTEFELESINLTTNQELLHQPVDKIINKLNEILLSAQKSRNSIWRHYFGTKSKPSKGILKETHGEFYIEKGVFLPSIILNTPHIQVVLKNLIQKLRDDPVSPRRS